MAAEGFLLHQRSYRSTAESDDLVADLRRGWDQHIAFGLAHPALHAVM